MSPDRINYLSEVSIKIYLTFAPRKTTGTLPERFYSLEKVELGRERNFLTRAIFQIVLIDLKIELRVIVTPITSV